MNAQCKRVIDYINQYGSITQSKAYTDIGVMRLASRILDLRKTGYQIEKKMIKAKNRYGEPVSFAQYNFADTMR